MNRRQAILKFCQFAAASPLLKADRKYSELTDPLLKLANTFDFARLAKARLDPLAWDYLDEGSDDELSLRANRTDFDRIIIRPHFLINDVSTIDTTTTLFGKKLTQPIYLSITGGKKDGRRRPKAPAISDPEVGDAATLERSEQASGSHQGSADRRGYRTRGQERNVGSDCVQSLSRWGLRQLASAALISGDWRRSDRAAWCESWRSCEPSWLSIWEWRGPARFLRSIARSSAFVHEGAIESPACSCSRNRIDVRTPVCCG
jgi:hypothetical protein